MLLSAPAGEERRTDVMHTVSLKQCLLVALLPLALAWPGRGFGTPASAAGAGGHARVSGKAPPAAGACAFTLPTDSTTLTIAYGDAGRTVIVHVPPASASGSPLPLVLNLHGSGSTASEQEQFSGMDTTADSNGFVVAYPQAALADDELGTPGFDWNVPGQPLFDGSTPSAGAPDDEAFLVALPWLLSQTACIDAQRVYATGFSGGARMASQLGCDAAGTFAAVAPVSGLRFPEPCVGSRPMPVLSLHGSADPIDPYAGNGRPYWTYSVQEAAQRWAAYDGCGGTSALGAPAAGVSVATYSGCSDSVLVKLYSLDGTGHRWPGGPALSPAVERLLGADPSGVNADDLIWRFFAAYALP